MWVCGGPLISGCPLRMGCHATELLGAAVVVVGRLVFGVPCVVSESMVLAGA